ncbi:hypothetical protein LOTGIDRAFT_161255 [Lottia gigantea]|uniref:Uncharacterized protein n=1 Tax=Lottia gigantea TaxID=225164 RepID=V4BZH6_LOTGI|nr:hypothetical protein LOTGIDRAFT_161255 [Lottia gigantea]ESO94554.1 hypothetical protein LOTGIDRAFT_161255 [Lottia gigantea]
MWKIRRYKLRFQRCDRLSKAQNLIKITAVTSLLLFTLNNVIFWTRIGKDAKLGRPQLQIRALLDSLLETKLQAEKLAGGYGLHLATTWTKTFQKDPVHKVVIENWVNISKQVKPVLVSQEGNIRMEVNSSDWSIISEVETECDRIPTLRGVLKKIMSKFTSKLYGFSNSDLIFGKDFWTSVKMVLGHSSLLKKPILILGKRINVKFNRSETYHIHDIPTIAQRGSYPAEGSSDIFITNKLFPWSNIPKIVVGRMGLGMWIVGYARAQNVTLIDITNTSTILHLTTNIGIQESGYARNHSFNIDLLHKLGFGAAHFQLGSLDCVDRFTQYDTEGKVQIQKRKVEPVCYGGHLNDFISSDKD